MFRGINAINLDTKGRMMVPARYRDQLKNKANNRVVITIDTEARCLLLYPLPDWEEIELKVSALPSFNSLTRRIQRLLIGHATEEELDNNGRILLPLPLRHYANLTKEITLIGQGKKFEIWDKKEWQTGRDNWLNEGLLIDEKLPEELKHVSL